MDTKAFERAKEKVMGKSRERKTIGCLSEKTLHAVLKNYLEPDEEKQEVKIGGYFADILNENGVTEIQTGSFTPLRPKLEQMLDYSRVTVVYPIAKEKRLVWLDPETGEVVSQRRSPKKGKPEDVFFELIRIKYTLDNPRFNLKIIMLELDEIRFLDGWSKDKKRGSNRYDRIPTKICEEIDICSVPEFDRFIPKGLEGQFTIKEFSKVAKISYDCAQRIINILCYLERLEQTGKRGREKLFSKIEI